MAEVQRKSEGGDGAKPEPKEEEHKPWLHSYADTATSPHNSYAYSSMNDIPTPHHTEHDRGLGTRLTEDDDDDDDDMPRKTMHT